MRLLSIIILVNQNINISIETLAAEQDSFVPAASLRYSLELEVAPEVRLLSLRVTLERRIVRYCFRLNVSRFPIIIVIIISMLYQNINLLICFAALPW